MNSLGLRELRHVSLRCSSLDEAEDFYTNAWGLELVERSIDRLWLRGTGPEHHILQFVESDNLGLEHVAFALATPEDVDSAAKHLVNMGVDLISEPHRSDDLGGGYRLTFNDPEGRCIMLAALLEAVAPRSEISNQPIQLSHVVFNTVDINAAVEFWTQVVGLSAIGPRTKWPFCAATTVTIPWRSIKRNGLRSTTSHTTFEIRTLFFNDSVSYVIWASCLSGVQAVTDRVTMLSLISAIQSAMFLK